MKIRFARGNFLLVLGVDALLVAMAWCMAYLVRFDFNIPKHEWYWFKWVLPILVVTKLITFYYFDLYRGMWRYTSIADLISIIKAATISSFLIIIFILFRTRFEAISRGVFLIDLCFTVLAISGFRLAIRLYFDFIPIINVVKITPAAHPEYRAKGVSPVKRGSYYLFYPPKRHFFSYRTFHIQHIAGH